MNDRAREKAISIRFPPQVWEAIHRLARTHKRSFNGEVIWALQEYARRAGLDGEDGDGGDHDGR